jgi:GH43 family beta-xylosidase
MLLAVSGVHGQEPGTLRNPLNAYGGADPWLTYYEGHYYLATTTWTSELTMRRSPTLAGLKTALPQRIYFETDESRCCNMWAPEFHLLDGPDGPRWYFYYTAGTAGTHANQHTHVLESAGTDPMGPYTYKARLYDPQNDGWAIDGSVLKLDDSLYFLFSVWVDPNQSLLIAPMSNPFTLSGSGVVISQPEYAWEKMGLNVNEAPVALYHGDQTFIIYSASFCATPDYKLGMLTYTGDDPLSADSWVKHPEPVFQRSDEHGVFAPGHNGFFQSPDGTENWIVYHANDSLDGACDGRRTTRVQPFTWHEDGTPNFGVPVSVQTEIPAPSGDTGLDPLPDMALPPIVRFRSLAIEDAYLRHANYIFHMQRRVNPLADSQFRIVPGLADSNAVSIESVNFPGYFVAHRSSRILLRADDGTADFAGAATWWLRPGLADEAGVSLESYTQPGNYIGQRMGIVALAEPESDQDRAGATFLQQ